MTAAAVPTPDLAAFAALRHCAACQALLPTPPAPAVCGACGTVAVVPSHLEWPAELKAWLLYELARRQFVSWRSRQDVWQHLLRLAVMGATAHHEGYAGGPTDLGAIYLAAQPRLAEWRASGARATDL